VARCRWWGGASRLSGSEKMNLKDNIWLIGAVIYVAGMFPLFYLYQAYPMDRFGLTITRMTIISIVGAVAFLFAQMFIGAMGEATPESEL
jgi:hypothetical protein